MKKKLLVVAGLALCLSIGLNNKMASASTSSSESTPSDDSRAYIATVLDYYFQDNKQRKLVSGGVGPVEYGSPYGHKYKEISVVNPPKETGRVAQIQRMWSDSSYNYTTLKYVVQYSY